MESTQAEWHPTQDTQQKHIDLRYAALGQGKGIKPSRKRKLADAEPVAEGPMDMEEDVVAAAEPDMASKRQRLDGESYRKVLLQATGPAVASMHDAFNDSQSVITLHLCLSKGVHNAA